MKRMNFLIGMAGISLALGMMAVGCDTGGGGVYVKGGTTYEADKGASVTGNKTGESEDVFRQY